MKTATAETGRVDGRSAHKIAEKMARNAGIDFEDWIAEAIAEYAEDLGVDPDALDERERLEAIEDRIDRHARPAAAARARPDRRELEREAPRRAPERERPASRYESRPLARVEPRSARIERDEPAAPTQDRLSLAIDAIERRAQQNERRAARVLESVTSLVEAPDSGRLEATIKQIEKRAERSEERTARAFESLAGLAEARSGERSRLEETIKQIEARAKRNEERTAQALESLSGLVSAGGGERDRLATTVQQIESRAQRNEERTARALESLSGLAEARSGETARLEDAIKQVQSRAERNEERAAQALESLSGLVEARGGERERLEEAIKHIEARSERNAERTARALESLKGLVETKQVERERLETAIERVGARASEAEARTAEALQSLSGLMLEKSARAASPPAESLQAAPSPSGARARPPAEDEDSEALRLVSERIARRRRMRGEPPKPAAMIEELADGARARPHPAPPAAVEAKPVEVAHASRANDLGGTIDNLHRDLSVLAERVEQLSDAAVGSAALEAIRRQTEEIQASLVAAARNAAPVERLEGQIAELAQRIERFAGAATAPGEIAAAVKTLADAQAQLARVSPVPALQAIERRIDELGARVEEASRRPAFDPRPLEDLARRVETVRTTVERQGANRPDAAVLASALQIINDKLDRASTSGSQSASTMTALQEMTSRLEEAVRRPDPAALTSALQTINDKLDRVSAAEARSASTMSTLHEMTSRLEEAIQRPASVSLDARPIEDLARRIDGVRGVVERQSAAAPKLDRIEASVHQLSQKLDRPATAAREIAGVEAAVKALGTKIETAVGRNAAADVAAIEDLTRRIDGLRKSVEPNAAMSNQIQRLESALDDIRARLDRPMQSPQIEAVDATLRRLAEKFEEAVGRPAPTFDAKPIEDLARRIDGMKSEVERQVAPHTAQVVAALGELREKLDRPGKPDTANFDAALKQLASQVGAAVNRPVVIDPKPIEDLARRIDGMKGEVERQVAPHTAQVVAALGELREKLHKPEAGGVDAALRQLASRVDAVVNRPVTVAIDPKPIEDLARRIDGVKGALERQVAPHNARLEAALGEISEKLDRPGSTDTREFDAALRRLTLQVEAAVNRPAAVAVDPAPMAELARRIGDVQGAVERQVEPQARLEAALDEIREKLDEPARTDAGLGEAIRALALRVDEVVNRPTTVAIDPKPIEDLANRIESVRASLERPQTLGPQVERLETALGLVSDKLDRAAPLIDANGLNSTLAEMNARLEEAFRRPAHCALGREPIDALSQRVEAVRESVERQGHQIDTVGRPIGELSRRLDAVRESVERQSEQFDLGRLEETFRSAVAKLDRPGVGGAELGMLVEAIERLALKVERGPSAFDISRLETLLQDIALRVDIPRGEGDTSIVLAAIQELSARIGRGGPSAEGHRLEELIEQVLDKLEDRVPPSGDMHAVVGALSELSDQIVRVKSPVNLAPVEELLHDMGGQLDRLDAKLSAAQENPAPDTDWPGVELLLRDFIAKVGDVRSSSDVRGVEQEIRVIHDKLDDLADARFDGQMAEHAARVIAEKIDQRASAANPEALLGHVQEIHERLDDIVASRPAAAELERSVADLADELETLRLTRADASRDSATLADVRADQLQLDRRLDARFASLREILETLLDRLGRLERAPSSETAAERAAFSQAPSAPPAERLALHDIPDRPQSAPRVQNPMSDVAPLAAQIAAQGRTRETGEVAAKSAAISAHIAAARRAANAAATDADQRAIEEAERVKSRPGLVSRARTALAQHRSSVLLGSAAAMALLTGVAVVELRGHAPVRKSELDTPVAPPSAHSEAEPAQKDAMLSDYDTMPTGALAAPKVVAAPLPTGLAKPALTVVKPSSELIAAMPAGLPTALAAAGSNGDLGAEVEIGQRYLEGRTVPRDPKMAAGWLQAAADSGSPFAQYRLGALYEKGVGVTRDAAKAREWYTKAANAGNIRAMHNLAVLYAQDGGAGKPDYANALDWFRRAASYGVRDSQFNLGVLYGRGLGAPQDLASAWMWFSLAAKQGDADAARKRDEVSNRMDGKIMAAATKMLADFKVKTSDSALNDAPAPPADASAQSAPADAPKGDAKGGGKPGEAKI